MRKLVFIALWFLPILTSAQLQVQFSDLTFHSNFEKKFFQLYNKDFSKNTLEMFIAASEHNDEIAVQRVEAWMENLFQELDPKINKQKKLRKKTKIIYETIQEKFLKNYQTFATFDQIFFSGRFNCVTATALYAYTLERYAIPFTIQLQPYHVYIVVDPEDQNIILESTDPQNGLTKIDLNKKKNFVHRLLSLNIITKNELRKERIEDLFDKHYMTDNKVISLHELIATQYYNHAIVYLEQMKYKEALSAIEKSEFLYNLPRNNMILITCLRKLVHEYEVNPEQNHHTLLKLIRYKHDNLVNEAITNRMNQLAETYLIKQNNPEKFEAIFSLYLVAVKDELLLKKLEEVYYTNKSKVAFLNYKYEEALSNLDCAHQLAPNDLNIKKSIAQTIIEKHRLNFIQQIEPDNIMDLIEQYPFLATNPYIAEIRKNEKIIAQIPTTSSLSFSDNINEQNMYIDKKQLLHSLKR